MQLLDFYFALTTNHQWVCDLCVYFLIYLFVLSIFKEE